MLSHELGFMSSWKMLTRDKGWIKPVLLLTLVGWIPILGQIAVLGYALEWARLTAWGVDAAPKQRGIDYGKLFSTGGRAFLVVVSIGLVVGLVLGIVFPGSLAVMGNALLHGGSSFGVANFFGVWSLSMLAVTVISVFVGSFINAAALRATLYDSFAAGWRIDRLFQMIARDPGGFFHAFGVSFIGSFITSAYAAIVGVLAAIVAFAGVAGVTAVYGLSGGYYYDGAEALSSLLALGAGPVLLFIVLGVVLSFVGAALATAMQLVGINAMGQWFCRFEVTRWGVSSAPLPDGVPGSRSGDWGSQASGMPRDPMGGDPVAANQVEPAAEAAEAVMGAVPVQNGTTSPVSPVTSQAKSVDADSATCDECGDEGVSAAETPVAGDAARMHSASAPVTPMAGAAPMPPVPGTPGVESAVQAAEDEGSRVEELSSLEAGAPVVQTVASSEGDSEEIAGEEQVCDEKAPIPMGPISTDDQEPEHEGPFVS